MFSVTLLVAKHSIVVVVLIRKLCLTSVYCCIFWFTNASKYADGLWNIKIINFPSNQQCTMSICFFQFHINCEIMEYSRVVLDEYIDCFYNSLTHNQLKPHKTNFKLHYIVIWDFFWWLLCSSVKLSSTCFCEGLTSLIC